MRAADTDNGSGHHASVAACCAVRWLAVAADHPALPGHFPGRPVVPGVVLLAHLQQLLGDHATAWHLRALPAVKFLRPVLPEQPMLLCLELSEPSAEQARCTARFAIRTVGDTALIAQGQLSLERRA